MLTKPFVRRSWAARPDDLKGILSEDELKLYRLIWTRFVASQMNPAVYDQTTVEISAKDYMFRASGRVMKFDGFLAVYEESRDEDVKPAEMKNRTSHCRRSNRARRCD